MITVRLGSNGKTAKVDTLNRLAVVPSSLAIEVALGRVTGMESVSKFGSNPDVDTTTDPEDIWSAGGLWVPPTTGRLHNVVSSSTDDDLGGIGAMEVKMFGLDASFSPISEVITMNGTTDVVTTKIYSRVFRAYVITSGSSGTNVGDITFTAVTDGTVTAQIDADLGQTEMAIYTIPNGKVGLLLSVYAVMGDSGGGSSASSEMRLFTVSNVASGTKTSRVRHAFSLISVGTSHYEHDFAVPVVIESLTDVILRCIEVSNSNTVLSGGFELITVDKNLLGSI